MGRRVFAISSCLSPVKENRAQPVDPASLECYERVKHGWGVRISDHHAASGLTFLLFFCDSRQKSY